MWCICREQRGHLLTGVTCISSVDPDASYESGQAFLPLLPTGTHILIPEGAVLDMLFLHSLRLNTYYRIVGRPMIGSDEWEFLELPNTLTPSSLSFPGEGIDTFVKGIHCWLMKFLMGGGNFIGRDKIFLAEAYNENVIGRMQRNWPPWWEESWKVVSKDRCTQSLGEYRANERNVGRGGVKCISY